MRAKRIQILRLPLMLALGWSAGFQACRGADEATPEERPKAVEVQLKIYDVRDLTAVHTDFPASSSDFEWWCGTCGAGGGAVNPFVPAPACAALDAPTLACLIQEKLLAADFADPATSIQESGGKLVVLQTHSVHKKIAEHLAKIRRQCCRRLSIQGL